MNYVLFAEMDQVFSFKKMGKNAGKVREFLSVRKSGNHGNAKA